jgi:hypothetical protein
MSSILWYASYMKTEAIGTAKKGLVFWIIDAIFRLMRYCVKMLPLLIMTLYLSASGQERKTADTAAPPDSLSLPIFTGSMPSSDSLKLLPGDSVFIFGGELYYRARSGDREFFVSRDSLVSHADSLVIYQYYRLGTETGTALSPDSAASKIERQRCTAITKDGTRCKRLAEPGSDRCWQHRR